MVKPRKLKFGLNIKIDGSVMCANFGDTRLRDRELRPQKPGKNAILGRKIINQLIAQRLLEEQSQNLKKMGAYKGFV